MHIAHCNPTLNCTIGWQAKLLFSWMGRHIQQAGVFVQSLFKGRHCLTTLNTDTHSITHTQSHEQCQHNEWEIAFLLTASGRIDDQILCGTHKNSYHEVALGDDCHWEMFWAIFAYKFPWRDVLVRLSTPQFEIFPSRARLYCRYIVGVFYCVYIFKSIFCVLFFLRGLQCLLSFRRDDFMNTISFV